MSMASLVMYIEDMIAWKKQFPSTTITSGCAPLFTTFVRILIKMFRCLIQAWKNHVSNLRIPLGCAPLITAFIRTLLVKMFRCCRCRIPAKGLSHSRTCPWSFYYMLFVHVLLCLLLLFLYISAH